MGSTVADVARTFETSRQTIMRLRDALRDADYCLGFAPADWRNQLVTERLARCELRTKPVGPKHGVCEIGA